MSQAAPVVVLVSTPFEYVLKGEKRQGFARRFLSVARRAEAEQDVAEGLAAGIKKELQAFTEEQLPRLPAKLRLDAYAAAGIAPPGE